MNNFNIIRLRYRINGCCLTVGGFSYSIFPDRTDTREWSTAFNHEYTHQWCFCSCLNAVACQLEFRKLIPSPISEIQLIVDLTGAYENGHGSTHSYVMLSFAHFLIISAFLFASLVANKAIHNDFESNLIDEDVVTSLWGMSVICWY